MSVYPHNNNNNNNNNNQKTEDKQEENDRGQDYSNHNFTTVVIRFGILLDNELQRDRQNI